MSSKCCKTQAQRWKHSLTSSAHRTCKSKHCHRRRKLIKGRGEGERGRREGEGGRGGEGGKGGGEGGRGGRREAKHHQFLKGTCNLTQVGGSIAPFGPILSGL